MPMIEPWPECCGAYLIHTLQIPGRNTLSDNLGCQCRSCIEAQRKPTAAQTVQDVSNLMTYGGKLYGCIINTFQYEHFKKPLEELGFREVNDWENPSGSHCYLFTMVTSVDEDEYVDDDDDPDYDPHEDLD